MDAIEHGIRRRSARVWAPRWVGSALLARGVLQPLSEWRVMRSHRLTDALELVERDSAVLAGQDPLLGVAADADPGGPGAGGARPDAPEG
ncbi:MAG: hypothetical protein ACRDKV_08030, partial [Solirubrobacterales bacterium]